MYISGCYNYPKNICYLRNKKIKNLLDHSLGIEEIFEKDLRRSK